MSKKEVGEGINELLEEIEDGSKEVIEKASKESGFKLKEICAFLLKRGGFVLEVLGEITGIPTMKIIGTISRYAGLATDFATESKDKKVEVTLSFCLLEELFNKHLVSENYKGETFKDWIKDYLKSSGISEKCPINTRTLNNFEKMYQERNLSELPKIKAEKVIEKHSKSIEKGEFFQQLEKNKNNEDNVSKDEQLENDFDDDDAEN